MQNVLKGWLADNTVTANNLEDKILVPESAGKATQADILSEMRLEDTGLRQETIEHVVNLYNRVTARLLLNGYQVNTGLFHGTAQFTGVVEGGVWNPAKNSIYISLIQDKELREAIAQTSVKILGVKAAAAYILSSEDTATRATDGTASAGRNYRLQGRQIKVAGTHPSVGIVLVATDGTLTPIPQDMIAVNNPSEVLLLLPPNLADGEYELRLTTQFSGSSTLLKEPRTLTRTLTIGEVSGGGGEGGGDVDNPMG